MEDFSRNRFCPDSDCGGIAEPEEELTEGGVLRYFVCSRPECGMEFGYEVVRDDVADGRCQLGVPEAVRVAMSKPPSTGGAVFLGSSIGRRPQLWDWT